MSIIRRCVQNPVAANMLMILLLGGGLVTSFLIPRELFPEFSVDAISVTVPYPGATSPADIEQNICLKIERELKGLEGVEEITSESREGAGTVLLKLYTYADVSKVLDEVKSRVDTIDFGDAEDPVTAELTLRQHVVHVAVAGDAPERTLKEIAQEVRDEINELPEVSQVSLSGVREYEISVEVSEESLRRHQLTLARVAQAIRDSSFDLPAGSVKTPAGETTIRLMGQLYWAEEFKKIPVLSRPDGTVVTLGEIGTVREGFEDVDIGGQFNGKPAVLVSVFKTPDEDTLKITRAVREYVDRKRPRMPEGIVLETWSDYSKLIGDRLSMLIRNGLWGLAFVILVLWLFLGLRLSFWVAMGIPVSLMGTVFVLYLGGMSLNMMSMFALIMALGLIVDDAIIVGENVYARVERGQPPTEAAVEGTRGVVWPVIGAVTTTWLAFSPLMFIPGVMGRFMEILPITVILALAFSLLECLVILPPHLGHSLRRRAKATASPGPLRRRAMAVRARLDRAIHWFIDVPFTAAYRALARRRYATVAAAAAVLAVVLAAYATGRLAFVGFPKLDSDTLQARLVLPTGTPIERTGAAARQMSDAARKLNQQYRARLGRDVVQRVYSLLGAESGFGGGRGSHVAEVIVELLPAERRGKLRSQELTDAWRANTGEIPEALSLTFGAFRGGPGGKALEVRLLGESADAVKPAAERLKDKLRGYPGVTDVEDDAVPGNMEMRIRLKRKAYPLGIRLRDLTQFRDAFWGRESLKVQRGRDEVKVMVRYPPHQRRSLGDVEAMRVRTIAGDEVPFDEVADVTMERGYTVLRRVNEKSVVTVSADVDEKTANAEKVLDDLTTGGFFAALEADHPGLKVDLRGQRQQVYESLDALKVLFPVALLGIYTILAAIFKSYTQPAIIMLAIPFGICGAFIGHAILGYDVTLLSLFGIVALTGIVVNDSLVLIDFINRRVRAGAAAPAAAEEGVRRRFRPILLTTATTVAGMAPILAERSFQAQFLKPMVVSIAFGLLFATLLTLLVVPCLYLIGNDLRRALRWLRTGRLPSAEELAQQAMTAAADAPAAEEAAS